MGEGNTAYRHGYYTHQAIAERRAMSALLKSCREAIAAA